MISHELWYHLFKHGQYQFIYWYRSPLQWNPSTFRLHKNHLNSIRGWVTGCIFSTVSALYVALFVFLSLLNVYSITFFTTVVALGEIVITLFGIVFGVASVINHHIFCQCLNGIFQLARQQPPGALLIPSKSKLALQLPKVERAMLFLLKMVQRIVLCCPLVTLILPFALTSEPVYFLLDYLLRVCVFKGTNNVFCFLWEKLLRGLLFTVLCVHFLMDIYQFLTFLLIVLSLKLKLFSLAYVKSSVIRNTDTRNKKLKTWLITEEFTMSLKFHFVYRIYRYIQLVAAYHDEMTLILYPSLFGLAYAGGVLAGFIVCFGYQFVSFFVYVVTCILSVVVAAAFACIFPRFCDFDICSIEFKAFWNKRLQTRLNKLRLASLRPVRIGIKPFFSFKKSQYLFVIWNMVSFSITIFLTFKDGFEHN